MNQKTELDIILASQTTSAHFFLQLRRSGRLPGPLGKHGLCHRRAVFGCSTQRSERKVKLEALRPVVYSHPFNEDSARFFELAFAGMSPFFRHFQLLFQLGQSTLKLWSINLGVLGILSTRDLTMWLAHRQKCLHPPGSRRQPHMRALSFPRFVGNES